MLKPSRVLEMLGDRAGYRRYVQEGLRDGHRAEYYDVIDQRFLGEERFVEKLKVQADEEVVPSRTRKPLSAAFGVAACAVNLEPEVL